MRSAPPRASSQAADSRARASSRPTNRPAPVSGAGRGGWVDGASGARSAAGRPRRTCSTSSRVSADGTMPSSRRSRSRSASNAPIAPARSPARASRAIRSRAAALAQRVGGDPAPAPLDRPGVVAGRPGARGQLAQQDHHLGPVLLAQPVGPLLVEPGQEVAVGEGQRLLEPPRRRRGARNSARSTRTKAGSGESPRRSRSLTSQASAPAPRAPRSAHAAWRRLLRALSSRASGRRVPARALRACSPGWTASHASRARTRADGGSSTGAPSGTGLEAPEDPDLQHRGQA